MQSIAPTEVYRLVALALGWIAYFALHSVLASLWMKNMVATRCPGCMAWYRLGYNALAVLLILPLLWITFAGESPELWRWRGPWGWLADGLALAAVGGFLWSLRYYSGMEFLGMEQLRRRQRKIEDQEQLYISPMHRFVRHPWYSLGLVILWTRDMDAAFLVTTIAITVYLVAGSRLEERKLIQYHGDAYRRYRKQVPPFIPLPWRWLDPNEAEAILRLSREQNQAASRPR